MSMIYRYTFEPSVPMEEVEATFILAVSATENQHGSAQTRLDAAHYIEVDDRKCVIDASTSVGVDLNRQFLGFIERQFGPDAFSVERLDKSNKGPVEQAHS